MQKAQSAMEYLITYSWAIIIIGITLGVLYALGLFSPTAFIQNQCIFPADFGCLSGFLYANGVVSLNIQQNTPSAINITQVACNAAGLDTNMTPNVVVPMNEIYMPVGGNYSFSSNCYSNGTIYVSQPGTVFKGYFIINYTTQQSGFQHIFLGRIIEKSS